MTERPLENGEHVDLDSGIEVERTDDYFTLHEGDSWTTLSRKEVEVLAELAGFTVTDPESDGGASDSQTEPWG